MEKSFLEELFYHADERRDETGENGPNWAMIVRRVMDLEAGAPFVGSFVTEATSLDDLEVPAVIIVSTVAKTRLEEMRFDEDVRRRFFRVVVVDWERVIWRTEIATTDALPYWAERLQIEVEAEIKAWAVPPP